MNALHRSAFVILVAMLAGCGGGGGESENAPNVEPEATPIIVEQSTAQGGDERTGAVVLVLPLPGPALHLDRPATVLVKLSGELRQSAHYGSVAVVGVELVKPYATAPSSSPAALTPSAPVAVPLDYAVRLQLPAGTYALQARVTVRALDANGTTTSALARAEASAAWTVEMQQ